MPPGLIVYNHFTGQILISHHAWTRFLQRARINVYKEDLTKTISEVYTAWLQASFSSAKSVKIPARHQLSRYLQNGLDECIYMFDTGLNLRYVVIKESKILLTVEVPSTTTGDTEANKP